MTVIALLSVAPVREGSMADDVARAVAALDDFDVAYQTNPMGTVIETDSIEELLAAVAAAHNAVEGDRVSTFLKIDHKRTSATDAAAKVTAVEERLGRPARRDRPAATTDPDDAATEPDDDRRGATEPAESTDGDR